MPPKQTKCFGVYLNVCACTYMLCMIKCVYIGKRACITRDLLYYFSTETSKLIMPSLLESWRITQSFPQTPLVPHGTQCIVPTGEKTVFMLWLVTSDFTLLISTVCACIIIVRRFYSLPRLFVHCILPQTHHTLHQAWTVETG